MAKKVKSTLEKDKTIIFHSGVIKLLIMEELKKREKTWEYFLFWAEFDSEHAKDAKISLGKKKRQSKGKEVVTPDKAETSTSRTRRRIDFVDDPNDKTWLE